MSVTQKHLFFFTERQSQKRGYIAQCPPKYAPGGQAAPKCLAMHIN